LEEEIYSAITPTNHHGEAYPTFCSNWPLTLLPFLEKNVDGVQGYAHAGRHWAAMPGTHEKKKIVLPDAFLKSISNCKNMTP
jgi:hypothetical protein